MNSFEFVGGYENCGLALPERKTAQAAGYDFMVAEDTIIHPYKTLITDLDIGLGPNDNNEPYTLDEIAQATKVFQSKPTLVPTGIKCKLDPDKYLQLTIRSSSPLKYWLVLANGVGIIDADYYNNPGNEGHIYFQVINLGPKPVLLQKGEIVGQGLILPYYTVEEERLIEGTRKGGFGSTGGNLAYAI